MQPLPASDSLRDRINQLSPSFLQAIQRNTGVVEDDKLITLISSGTTGFARLQPISDVLNAESTDGQQAGGYVDALRQSRALFCPDGPELMARAFGVSDQLFGLQGSALSPPQSSEGREQLEQLRQQLKSNISQGWSGEALRRGISSAKAGDYGTAHRSYQQAIDLDRRNCDAYVARGAAYANERLFEKAAADFKTALEINPGHVNAATYLSKVQPRLPEARPLLAPHQEVTPQPLPSRPRPIPHSAPAPGRGDESRPILVSSESSSSSSEDEGAHASEGHKTKMSLEAALKIVSKHQKKRDQHRSEKKKRSKMKRHKSEKKKGRRERGESEKKSKRRRERS